MSVTIEQQRQRVEHEMTKNVDDLDRSFLRKVQVDMGIFNVLRLCHGTIYCDKQHNDQG